MEPGIVMRGRAGFRPGIWAFGILCLAGPLARGQRNGEDPRRIAFSVFGAGEAWREELFWKDANQKPRRLEFRRFTRSPEYVHPGPYPVVFYRKKTAAYRPAARAVIPPDGEKFLFIFYPREAGNEAAPEETEDFRVFVLDDSLRAAPANTVVFFNATGSPLDGVLGDEKIHLPEGLAGPFPLPGKPGNGVFTGFAARREGVYKKVLENRWLFHPRNRHMVLLMPPENPGGERIQACRLAEYVPPDREPLDPPSERGAPGDGK